MTLRHKGKTTTGYTWTGTDLVEQQIGVNLFDGTLHVKKSTAGGGTYVQFQNKTQTDLAYEPFDLAITKSNEAETITADWVFGGDVELSTGTMFLPDTTGEGIRLGDIATGTYGWHDLIAEIKTRGVGQNDPTWAVINASAFSAYKFGIGDRIWQDYHMPHDYVPGSDIHFHVHWLSDGVQTNTVKWQWTYTYASGHQQQAYNFTGTVVTAEQAGQGTANYHMIAETAAVTISGLETDGIVAIRLERITNGATNNTDDIFVLLADIHYQSTGTPTLNKAPNFYGV